MSKKILVAVALPYVNGEPHLGHIAGMNVPADIFARYHRLRGNQVVMVSGSLRFHFGCHLLFGKPQPRPAHLVGVRGPRRRGTIITYKKTKTQCVTQGRKPTAVTARHPLPSSLVTRSPWQLP